MADYIGKFKQLYYVNGAGLLALLGPYNTLDAAISEISLHLGTTENDVYEILPTGFKVVVITSNVPKEYIFIGGTVTANHFIPLDTTYSEATTAAAGLMSASDKEKVDLLIPVYQAGGWNVDKNYQVGGTGGGTSTIPADLNKRLLRIESILGDLYDDNDPTGASDAYILIQGDEDNGVSNS